MNERRRGTRCSVCTFCGRCFADEGESAQSDDQAPRGWSGTRCEVCVECGKCARAWGVVGEDPDALSAPTNWADAFKVMDDGSAGAPPPTPGAPGERSCREWDEQDSDECDAVTGATPGVATACRELGLDDMANLAGKLGIKPPGQA